MNCHIKRPRLPSLVVRVVEVVLVAGGLVLVAGQAGVRLGELLLHLGLAQPVAVVVSGRVELQRGDEPAQSSRNILIHTLTRLPVAVGLHGPLHDEEPGQQVDEDPPDPGRHQVGLGRPEVDVEHHDRHADAATQHIQSVNTSVRTRSGLRSQN